MNPDKLFSLLSPKQVLSQESQQAYQSKVDTAKAENKMIKEKVVNPFFSFADKSFKKIMEVLNPGESYVAPALKKMGVNPIVAGGIGLGVDILAPGPGELGRVAKVGKEIKVGSELLQEAKKYKSAEEFVKAVTKDRGGVGRGVDYSPAKRLVETSLNDKPITDFGFKPNDKITIYRGVDNATQKTIKPGDYIALSRDLAKSYTGGKVISQKVPASSIRVSSGDGLTIADFKDINNLHIEAVYNPNPLIKPSQLTDIYHQATKQAENPLLAEAKKYKSAEEFVKAQQPTRVKFTSAKAVKDYMGGHEAPMAEDINNPIWDLMGKHTGNELYPKDIYSSDASRMYSSGMEYDNQAISILHSVKDRPNAKLTIYRAVPKDVKGEINPGDWVAITKEYAKDHGESNINGAYKIIKKEVFARDIFTDANSIQEFGYDPQPRLAPKDTPYEFIKRAKDGGKPTIYDSYVSQLTDMWNQANKKTK